MRNNLKLILSCLVFLGSNVFSADKSHNGATSESLPGLFIKNDKSYLIQPGDVGREIFCGAAPKSAEKTGPTTYSKFICRASIPTHFEGFGFNPDYEGWAEFSTVIYTETGNGFPDDIDQRAVTAGLIKECMKVNPKETLFTEDHEDGFVYPELKELCTSLMLSRCDIVSNDASIPEAHKASLKAGNPLVMNDASARTEFTLVQAPKPNLYLRSEVKAGLRNR